jgi:hypothetical protein
MATPEQEAQGRQQLTTLLDEIGKVDPKSLARTETLGSEMNFEAGVPHFQRISDLFATLARMNLDGVPYATLQQLSNQTQEALNLFRQVQTFSVSKEPNPVQAKDALVTRARDSYDNYWRVLSPTIAYLTGSGTDFEALERSAREYLKKMEEQVATTESKISGTGLEVERILEKVKTAAAEVGVAQHSIHFHDEAEKHRLASGRWLLSVIGLCIAAAVFSLWYFQRNLQSLSGSPYWWIHLGYFGSRLLVLSVIFFGIAWSASNFKSHKHNEVVNRHRQNALRTFETFVKAAGEKETRDTVLIAATKSIFEGQSSGYLSSEHEQVPSSTIVEILRNVSSGKK